MPSYPGTTKQVSAGRATKPVTRSVPTPRGRASDLNLAARVHQTAAYRPEPFPAGRVG